jgi:MFS family permease
MDATNMARAPAGFASFLRIGLVQTVGFNVYLILPGYVAALSDLMGFGKQAAGLIASATLAGIAIGTFAGIALQKPFGTRKPMLAGLVAMAALDLVSPYVLDLVAHGAIRFAAGIAAGVALAMGSALVARPSNAQRGFSVVVFMNTSFAALMLFFLTGLLSWGGMRALYWLLALMELVAAALLAFEPLHDRVVPPAAEGTSRAFSPGALLGMLSFGLFIAGLGVSWTYMAGIGTAHGIEPATVGMVLGGGALIGLAGAATAGALGTQFGRVPTMVLAIGVVVAMLCVMRFVEGPIGFLAAVLFLIFFWNFAPPFFAGLLADFDPSGKALASSTSVLVILNAVAPSLAAALLSPEGYGNVLLATILIVATTIPLYVIAARKL